MKSSNTIPAILADAMSAESTEVARCEAAVTAAQAALDTAYRECNADAEVKWWIGYRADADALHAEDREALLRGGFTRRLLVRRLIYRNSTLWPEYDPTEAGEHVAHILRGDPPPPSVVMRAAWHVWRALGRRGMASSAYEAWSAGAKTEDATRHAAEIEKLLAESATPPPDAAALWRALMGTP